MTTTTHAADTVTIDVFLAAVPVTAAALGVVLFGVDKATNSLNSQRVVTYTSTADALTDKTAGFISANTYAEIQTAFAQEPAPTAVKVGNCDRVQVAASKTSWPGSGNKYLGHLTAVTAGQDGNNITLTMVSDTTESIAVAGTAITVHFNHGVSTTTTINTLINGYGAAAALVTASNNDATALDATAAFSATNLTGGSGETWAEGYAAWVAADPAFYGVCINERTDASITSIAGALTGTLQLGMFQSADAGLLTNTFPAGLSTLQTNEDVALIYHDTATVWADGGYAVAGLAVDPNTQSGSWMIPVASVAGLATGITASQLAFLFANNTNVGLGLGTAAFFVKNGVTCTGRPIYEKITKDWLTVTLQSTLINLFVQLGSLHQKLGLDKTGQAQCKAAISGVFQTAESAGHIEPGWTVTAETITSTDIANKQLRFTVQAIFLNAARSMAVNVYLSES